MKSNRGFTLAEMLVAMAIMAVVIAMTGALLVAAVRLARSSELKTQAVDTARSAVDAIAASARQAGMGAAGGVWVGKAGTAVLTNALYGLDGTTPPTVTTFERDDLWLVIPHKNAMRQSCVKVGAAAVVTLPGTGTLNVNCVSSINPTPAIAPSPMNVLLASNLRTAALLTNPTYVTATTIGYTEAAIAGFSNAPEKGGFQGGDMVMPAMLVHYYIQVSARTGNPDLYRSWGRVANDAYGRPFSDSTISELLVQNVEDLQFAFGFDTALTGDPTGYVFRNGLLPTQEAGLRSLRITAVSRSATALRDSNSSTLLNLAPVAAENHSPTATRDGFYRTTYTRRIELPNMAPEAL